MTRNVFGLIGLSFAVDALLLMAAGRLCGNRLRILRLFIAAGFSSIYIGICLQPEFYFLGNTHWRVVCLTITAVIAYGVSWAGVRSGIAFAFLYLVLGSGVLAVGNGGIFGTLCSLGGMIVLLYIGILLLKREGNYIPVELTYGDKHLCLTALRDTGNALCDPVTGQQVLVVGGDIAMELTGLTKEQLSKPVESVGVISGLRLIPYHTVANSGFLLAMRLHNAKIGSWRGSAVVAFAPEVLNREGMYQALTGGAV